MKTTYEERRDFPMKKWMAAAMSAMLAFSAAAPVSAAGRSASNAPCSVTVDGSEIEVYKDGETEIYSARTSAVKLYQNGNNLYLRYEGRDSVQHDVLLGDQDEIEVDGSIGLLEMHRTIDDNFLLTIPETGNVTNLSVSSGSVDLYGSVTTVSALQSDVRVVVMEGAHLTRANVTAGYNVTGLGLSYNTPKTMIDPVDEDALYDRYYWRDWHDWRDRRYRYDDAYRYVDIYFDGGEISSSDTITLGASSTMGDAARELERHCSARDRYTGRTVSGTFHFDGFSSSAATSGRHSWTFEPYNDEYRRVSGSVTIRIR